MDTLAYLGGAPVRNKPIYYGHQYIDENDIQSVIQVLKSDFLTCGPKIEELQEKLCKLTGAKYAVVVSNGTAALHAACMAAGIGNHDEVITSPVTFAASANCALYCGAVPVFADIDKDTYNISPKEIRAKVTSRTKAVIAVDFTGQAAQLDEIARICKDKGIILIEDASHAIGTIYDGQAVGSIADMTTFSFHPVKTVTGGEGGAVLTNSRELYEKLLLFRAHGITRKAELMSREADGDWYYEQVELGFNYRMTDIQAALIISQLDKLELFKKLRHEIVQAYNCAFESMEEIVIQKEIPQSDTSRHLYILQLKLEELETDRRGIFDALKAENIYCNVHYIPVYYFPYYQKLGYKKGLCPEAEKLYERIITLPLYYGMTSQDVNDVVTAVKKVISYYSVHKKN